MPIQNQNLNGYSQRNTQFDITKLINNKQQIIETFLKKKNDIKINEKNQQFIRRQICEQFNNKQGIVNGIQKNFYRIKMNLIAKFKNQIFENSSNNTESFDSFIDTELINDFETLINDIESNVTINEPEKLIFLNILNDINSELELKNKLNGNIFNKGISKSYKKLSKIFGQDKELYETRLARFLTTANNKKDVKRYLTLNFLRFGLNAGVNAIGLATAGGACLAFTGSKTLAGFLFGGAIADANNGIKSQSAKEILLVGLNMIGYKSNELNENILSNIDELFIDPNNQINTQKISLIYSFLSCAIKQGFDGIYKDLNLGKDFSEDKLLLLKTLYKIDYFAKNNNIKFEKSFNNQNKITAINTLIQIRHSRVKKGAIYGGIAGAIADYFSQTNNGNLLEKTGLNGESQISPTNQTQQQILENKLAPTQTIPTDLGNEATKQGDNTISKVFNKERFNTQIKAIFDDIQSDHSKQNYITLEQSVRRIQGLKQGIGLDKSVDLKKLNKEIFELIRKPDGEFINAIKKLGYIKDGQTLDQIAPKFNKQMINNILEEVYKNDDLFNDKIEKVVDNSIKQATNKTSTMQTIITNNNPLSENLTNNAGNNLSKTLYSINKNIDPKLKSIIGDLILGTLGLQIISKLGSRLEKAKSPSTEQNPGEISENRSSDERTTAEQSNQSTHLSNTTQQEFEQNGIEDEQEIIEGEHNVISTIPLEGRTSEQLSLPEGKQAKPIPMPCENDGSVITLGQTTDSNQQTDQDNTQDNPTTTNQVELINYPKDPKVHDDLDNEEGFDNTDQKLPEGSKRIPNNLDDMFSLINDKEKLTYGVGTLLSFGKINMGFHDIIPEFERNKDNFDDREQYIQTALNKLGFIKGIDNTNNQTKQTIFIKRSIGGNFFLYYEDNINNTSSPKFKIVWKDNDGIEHISYYTNLQEFNKNNFINKFVELFRKTMIYKDVFCQIRFKNIKKICLNKEQIQGIYNQLEHPNYKSKGLETKGELIGSIHNIINDTFYVSQTTFPQFKDFSHCTPTYTEINLMYTINTYKNSLFTNSHDDIERLIMFDCFEKGIYNFAGYFYNYDWHLHPHNLGNFFVLSHNDLNRKSEIFDNIPFKQNTIQGLVICLPKSKSKQYIKNIQNYIQNNYNMDYKNKYYIINGKDYGGTDDYLLLMRNQFRNKDNANYTQSNDVLPLDIIVNN